jgi:hypothetical protein
MPYVLTGKAATLVAARIPFAAATQSCAVSGVAAGLRVGYKIAPATDVFAVAGTAAVNWATRALAVATVAVAIVGTAVTSTATRKLGVTVRGFEVSGTAVVLSASHTPISAATDLFVVSGAAVALTLIQAREIAADVGVFAISGIVAAPAAGRRMGAERAGGCALTWAA